MSEISSNFGMESLNVAMLKRSSDNQGQMALALLEGAVQTSQQIQANAPAAPQVQPVAHAEGTLGANIDITAQSDWLINKKRADFILKLLFFFYDLSTTQGALRLPKLANRQIRLLSSVSLVHCCTRECFTISIK